MKRFLPLAALALCAALPLSGCSAPLPPIVEIERLTWLEVRDRVAEGATTILVPTGGTEGNGPHMALGKHNRIVAETARRIALELGDALVAPVMAYVPEGDPQRREGHMAHAGTISLPEPVFAGVLEAAARSFKAHGFKTIVFVGDSGGNQGAQDEVAAVLAREWRDEGVRVMNARAYYGANGGIEYLKSRGETDATIGAHAGIRDTSELLAAARDLVHLERAGPGGDGASGDARRANGDLGATLLGLKVAAGVREIRRVRGF